MNLGSLNRESAVRLVRLAVAIYLVRWRILVGATALTVVPVSLLQAFLLRGFEDPLTSDPSQVDPQAATVLGVFSAAYLLVITPLIAAIVLRAVAEHVATVTTEDHASATSTRDGSTFEELYAFGFERLLTIVGITIASGVAVALGFLALVVPGIWLLGRLYLALPVAIVEGTGMVPSLRRSWELAAGRVLRVLGTLGVSLLLMFAVTIVAQELLRLVADAVGWLLTGLIDGLISSAVLPFGFVVAMLLYLDARARSEDFTREELAAALGHGGRPDAW